MQPEIYFYAFISLAVLLLVAIFFIYSFSRDKLELDRILKQKEQESLEISSNLANLSSQNSQNLQLISEQKAKLVANNERIDELIGEIDTLKAKIAQKDEDENAMERILFFTLIIENASLFSQFATVLSFARFRGYLKNVANIIAWTSIDEQLHANAGIYILKKIFEERPEMKTVAEREATNFIRNYILLEDKMLDWIFEQGELEFFSKKDLANYMRYRLDDSLTQLGLDKPFNISGDEAKPMMWFEEEVFSNELDDFFAKRPTAYTKHDKSITENDLF